ncbi:protein DNA-DAMAGE INDUCIBLE 1-like [Castanea sativa]|uniref:protein DNA-DAMAGE INDUCIBLE 1-like n=1 Tax=Castanea sativa TaxID=21020 RepID=UPI003F649C65
MGKPLVVTLVSSRLLRLIDQRYKGIAQGVDWEYILSLLINSIGFSQYGIPLWPEYAPEAPDLKDNVLRVGGGEVSVPFLQEKDIPSHFLSEERLSKQAFSSGGPHMTEKLSRFAILLIVDPVDLGPDFEAKVAKLVELGLGWEAVIQALKLFEGNEDQAAGFIFGG